MIRSAYRFLRPAIWRRPEPRYSDYDLRRLDFEYARMYRQHETLHRGLTTEIAALCGHRGTLLEVACGTGWNSGNFTDFDYCGLDISETALSLAMRRHPERKFLNLGIREADILKDASFDVVYNSSMLEHIGYAEEAIGQMMRLARKHLFIMFFEGFAEKTSIDFHAYSPEALRSKDIYGRKVVLQDHGRPEKGWYWNRYSYADIARMLKGAKHEVLTRPWITNQSVLHVML